MCRWRAIRRRANSSATHCLGRLDTVDGDLVVDGDQPLTVAAVERVAQIGERLARPSQRRPRVTERGDPAGEIACGVQPVVPRVRLRIAARPANPSSTNCCWYVRVMCVLSRLLLASSAL